MVELANKIISFLKARVAFIKVSRQPTEIRISWRTLCRFDDEEYNSLFLDYEILLLVMLAFRFQFHVQGTPVVAYFTMLTRRKQQTKGFVNAGYVSASSNTRCPARSTEQTTDFLLSTELDGRFSQ